MTEAHAPGSIARVSTSPSFARRFVRLQIGLFAFAVAIALMVDLMCGPLIGEVSSVEAGEQDNGDGGPATGGELILAFDPAAFGGGDAMAGAESLIGRLSAMEGVRLPGDRRFAARKSTPADGVDIPLSLYQTIVQLIG